MRDQPHSYKRTGSYKHTNPEKNRIMSLSQIDPENTQNAEAFEMQMAVKAVEQSEAYWGLLHKIKGSKLRLTK